LQQIQKRLLKHGPHKNKIFKEKTPAY